MDTVTHGLIGALASNAGFHKKAGKYALVSFVVGAVFPDTDIALSIFGADVALRYHRGFTHSVVCAPFFALVLGFLTYLFSSFKNLWLLVLMTLVGMLSHIFFDLITSYGTVIFDPLSQKRYALDLVFIIDPFITLPLIASLILIWRKRLPTVKTSISVFAYLALYLLLSYCARLDAEARLLAVASERGILVKRATVYPEPFAPFFWLGVIDGGDYYYRAKISIPASGVSKFEEVRKNDESPYLNVAKRLDLVRLYYWFAEYPVARYRKEGEHHVLEFYDLRFSGLGRPFLLRVALDKFGAPVQAVLNGRTLKKPG
ncbi:MAG: metal-dependent hydrolase [Candidatus Methanosuratincola sp.]